MPAALRILTEGKVADVDLGHVAGRHFANLTSLGLSVQVAAPLDLDVVGEIRGRTPAEITLEANALRVMVAADFPDV
jgi:diacylglycerol kinase family enzyme